MTKPAQNSGRATLRALRCSLLAGATLIVGQQAFAQSTAFPSAPLTFKTNYFGYAANVSPRVTYTDNINLAPKGFENDDVIASTVFTASTIYSNRRFTGLMSGNLDFSYLTGQEDLVVNQDITAAGTLTVADNLIYVDIAGSTNRQLLGDIARFSQNINAGRNQRANVHNVVVSPYINHEFKNTAVAELRYRFSKVFVDDGNLNTANGLETFPNGFLNDSQTQEVFATLNSGKAVDRFKIGVTAYGNKTREDGSLIAPSFDFEQGTLLTEMEYAVNDRFALTGAVGYDDITSDAPIEFIPADDLTGVFWRAGFRAKPGRKTDVKLEYGNRYGDDFVNGLVSYDINDRLQFRARASREFQTRAQAISTRVNTVGKRTLEFADALRQGEALSPDAILQAATRFDNGVGAQTIGLGVTNEVNASLIALGERTTITATGGFADTDFGFQQIDTLFGQAAIQHRLSRQVTAYGDVFWRDAQTSLDQGQCVSQPGLFGLNPNEPLFDAVSQCALFALQREDVTTVGGRIGASYQFYKNLAVFGEFAHTSRFSPLETQEFGENVFTAGLTLDF